MASTPNLQMRLRLKEALGRVNDARRTAGDSWTASRLQLIARDLEDTLNQLAREPATLHPVKNTLEA
ncbi:MAG: hypothetical protein ACLP7P_02975 [Rhodomicrobium sp.]